MRFSLFHIPIRIKPGFVVLAVAIGFLNVSNPQLEPVRVQLFVGVVLATGLGVLIHELGHAVEARRAGAIPDVILNLFGASPGSRRDPRSGETCGSAPPGSCIN
jgi:Zn-dependent protease